MIIATTVKRVQVHRENCQGDRR